LIALLVSGVISLSASSSSKAFDVKTASYYSYFGQ